MVVRLFAAEADEAHAAPESMWDLDSTEYGPVVSLGPGAGYVNICCINLSIGSTSYRPFPGLPARVLVIICN